MGLSNDTWKMGSIGIYSAPMFDGKSSANNANKGARLTFSEASVLSGHFQYHQIVKRK